MEHTGIPIFPSRPIMFGSFNRLDCLFSSIESSGSLIKLCIICENYLSATENQPPLQPPPQKRVDESHHLDFLLHGHENCHQRMKTMTRSPLHRHPHVDLMEGQSNLNLKISKEKNAKK